MQSGPAWYELSIDGGGTYWLTVRRAVVLGRSSGVPAAGGFGDGGEGEHARSLIGDGASMVDGRGARDGEAFLPLLGPVARRHARIVDEGEGHRLEAFADCTVESRSVRGAVWLPSSARIALAGLTIRFARPQPATNTAVLRFDEPNRTVFSVDGVVLYSDILLIGGGRSHLSCGLEPEVLLVANGTAQTGGPVFRLGVQSPGTPAGATVCQIPPDGGCCQVEGRMICIRPLGDSESDGA
ncbi:MAG: hypothetical protein D6725_13060 [Planctomycetota bacterium]|nr:MAG: hypothetical protein D6725_13060 [Planctomycetota bacterium]